MSNLKTSSLEQFSFVKKHVKGNIFLRRELHAAGAVCATASGRRYSDQLRDGKPHARRLAVCGQVAELASQYFEQDYGEEGVARAYEVVFGEAG